MAQVGSLAVSQGFVENCVLMEDPKHQVFWLSCTPEAYTDFSLQDGWFVSPRF